MWQPARQPYASAGSETGAKSRRGSSNDISARQGPRQPKFSRRTFITATGLGIATIPLTGVPGTFSDSASAAPSARVVTSLDVLSDVQGDLDDFADALTDLHSLGTADALVINGDLVVSGTVEAYEDLYATLASIPHPNPVLAPLGNHEQY